MDGTDAALPWVEIGAFGPAHLDDDVVGICFDWPGAVFSPACPCGAMVASLAAVAIAAAIPLSSVEDVVLDANADLLRLSLPPATAVVFSVDVGVGIGSGILLPYGDCMDRF